VWRTQEILSMVEWMAAYNKGRRDQPALSFGGFDMQITHRAQKCAVDTFGRLGKAEQETIRQLYQGVERLDEDDDKPLPAEEKEKLCQQAAQAMQLFDSKRNAFAKVATPFELSVARQCARVVEQACEISIAPASEVLGVRDRMMAENVRWLVNQAYPGQKIVLWAHNGHVGTATIGMGNQSMGVHLRKTFGKEMVVLGLAFARGAVRARPKVIKDGKEGMGEWKPLELAAPHPQSVEALFAETGIAHFILDFRAVPSNSALGEWLARPRRHWSIGASYDPDQWSDSKKLLPATYNGMIFVADSSAAKPLNR